MGYSREMLVCKVVDAHPKASEVLVSFGLPCHKCIVAFSETLEEGLRPHGISPEVVIAALDERAPLPQHGKKAGK